MLIEAQLSSTATSTGAMTGSTNLRRQRPFQSAKAAAHVSSKQDSSAVVLDPLRSPGDVPQTPPRSTHWYVSSRPWVQAVHIASLKKSTPPAVKAEAPASDLSYVSPSLSDILGGQANGSCSAISDWESGCPPATRSRALHLARRMSSSDDGFSARGGISPSECTHEAVEAFARRRRLPTPTFSFSPRTGSPDTPLVTPTSGPIPVSAEYLQVRPPGRKGKGGGEDCPPRRAKEDDEQSFMDLRYSMLQPPVMLQRCPAFLVGTPDTFGLIIDDRSKDQASRPSSCFSSRDVTIPSTSKSTDDDVPQSDTSSADTAEQSLDSPRLMSPITLQQLRSFRSSTTLRHGKRPIHDSRDASRHPYATLSDMQAAREASRALSVCLHQPPKTTPETSVASILKSQESAFAAVQQSWLPRFSKGDVDDPASKPGSQEFNRHTRTRRGGVAQRPRMMPPVPQVPPHLQYDKHFTRTGALPVERASGTVPHDCALSTSHAQESSWYCINALQLDLDDSVEAVDDGSTPLPDPQLRHFSSSCATPRREATSDSEEVEMLDSPETVLQKLELDDASAMSSAVGLGLSSPVSEHRINILNALCHGRANPPLGRRSSFGSENPRHIRTDSASSNKQASWTGCPMSARIQAYLDLWKGTEHSDESLHQKKAKSLLASRPKTPYHKFAHVPRDSLSLAAERLSCRARRASSSSLEASSSNTSASDISRFSPITLLRSGGKSCSSAVSSGSDSGRTSAIRRSAGVKPRKRVSSLNCLEGHSVREALKAERQSAK
ncbi:hypothetical protein IE81DRAFT_83463 [Ceraceosorus guamensis]|uniref:Uncharacterized protein n=1 Tax=Ceraceosorus guamensis TaxID=1522189 RepID=A0A316W887_9BASI|nr:hypothetical protein IE81DRAFT_83463 [Ceraceosorus guamensis]PWN46107.1 hypothetical protein IE81DRAFT_83463 [Ceraceosorus guamensis]